MWSTFVTIWILHVAALMTPGQNVLLISQLAASGSRRNASYAALGITVGAAIWSSAAVLGAGTVLNAAATVRLVVQMGGAVYLLYVAVLIWRTPPPERGIASQFSDGGAFRVGLLTNLSNPKSALFFISIFSAALPEDPTVPVLMLSVVLVVFNAFWWHLLVAFVFSHRAVQLRYARQRKILTRLCGSVIGAIGLSLLFSSLREVRM